jgi:hypothetical protein
LEITTARSIAKNQDRFLLVIRKRLYIRAICLVSGDLGMFPGTLGNAGMEAFRKRSNKILEKLGDMG